MSSRNNIILTLLGLSVLLYTFKNNNQIKENFGMLPSRTVKVQRVMQTGPRVGDFVEIPGNYQSSLSPIGGAGMVDYGALIRYNLPSNGKLRTPDYKTSTPLTYANMVSQKCQHQVEGFCSNCNGSPAGCRKGGGGNGGNGGGDEMMKTSNLVPSDYSSSNYASQYNKLNYNETTDLLPVQEMGGQMLNALGQTSTQPIIYDRFIYANQKSRQYAQGDPIRGDLPIVPIRSEWFRPSVHPQIDLRDGALAVVGGPDNSTSNELLALQNAATAGLLDTGSGVNYSVQKSSFATSAGGDIQVTAFP